MSKRAHTLLKSTPYDCMKSLPKYRAYISSNTDSLLKDYRTYLEQIISNSYIAKSPRDKTIPDLIDAVSFAQWSYERYVSDNTKQ